MRGITIRAEEITGGVAALDANLSYWWWFAALLPLTAAPLFWWWRLHQVKLQSADSKLGS